MTGKLVPRTSITEAVWKKGESLRKSTSGVVAPSIRPVKRRKVAHNSGEDRRLALSSAGPSQKPRRARELNPRSRRMQIALLHLCVSRVELARRGSVSPNFEHLECEFHL